MLRSPISVCYCSLLSVCLFKCICFRLPFGAFLSLPVTTTTSSTTTTTTSSTRVTSRSAIQSGSGGGGQTCRSCFPLSLYFFSLSNNGNSCLLYGWYSLDPFQGTLSSCQVYHHALNGIWVEYYIFIMEHISVVANLGSMSASGVSNHNAHTIGWPS